MDIILIDARNAVWRHGYTRSLLRNSAGTPTGAIFGFLGCLLRLKKFYPDAKFVLCWDGKEPWKSWRHNYCDTYKASRHKPGSPDLPIEVKNILSQIPAIKKVAGILNLPQFEVDRLEADDLIGVLSKAFTAKDQVDNVYIYSMDKDMFGLIGGKVSVVRDLDKAKKCKAFKAKDVLKEYGVTSKAWAKYRALIGDPSDGIKPAIRGVGKVTAVKLLSQGLDPSKKDPTLKIEKQYKKHWRQCHMNYVLSKIIIDADSKKLPKATSKQLLDILKNLDFIPEAENKVGAARRFVKFCAEYELNCIMEQRYQFFKLM